MASKSSATPAKWENRPLNSLFRQLLRDVVKDKRDNIMAKHKEKTQEFHRKHAQNIADQTIKQLDAVHANHLEPEFAASLVTFPDDMPDGMDKQLIETFELEAEKELEVKALAIEEDLFAYLEAKKKLEENRRLLLAARQSEKDSSNYDSFARLVHKYWPQLKGKAKKPEELLTNFESLIAKLAEPLEYCGEVDQPEVKQSMEREILNGDDESLWHLHDLVKSKPLTRRKEVKSKKAKVKKEKPEKRKKAASDESSSDEEERPAWTGTSPSKTRSKAPPKP